MPLIYDNINKEFIKKNSKKHSGSNQGLVQDNISEAFSNSFFINQNKYNSSIFEYNTPVYYTVGGTTNYYSQDYYSIFTNISKPFIKFVFTANTSFFGTGVTIKHNVYKIPYSSYLEYTTQKNRKSVDQNNNFINEKTEEININDNGILTKKTTLKSTEKNYTTENLSPDFFPKEINEYDINKNNNINKIKEFLQNPILSITGSTTGITTNTYKLFLEEYQKNLGDFEYQFFEDYGQYFLTTQFEFVREIDEGRLKEIYYTDKNDIIKKLEKSNNTESTSLFSHIITGGTFSGTSVCGNFFTYFLIPNKPELMQPYVKGTLNTFTPSFFWTNTNDADSYLLQVIYDYNDSTSFSGLVYSYPIKKENTILKSKDFFDTIDESWGLTQKNTDIIREYSVPLLKNKTFWYRIGNIKEMINIFGTKQSVVTFSDVMSATTSNSYASFVYVQSDSPNIETLPSWTYPSYLDDDLDKYSLSGTVIGSSSNIYNPSLNNITGATINLIYPNGNFITLLTDNLGDFCFSNIDAGLYTMNITYRGYNEKTININLLENTNLGFIKIDWLWGNNYDNFEKLKDDLIFE